MMTNGKYVSIENIISKVYRDLGMTENLNINDAIEWAGEAMELIGASVYLEDKVCPIEIRNYKGKLPCELHYIVTSSGLEKDLDLESETDCELESDTFIPMRYTTDAYHHWYCGQSDDHNCVSDMTYSVNDDYIFVNFEEGKVLMAYKGMPVDDRGFPKIPDDIKFREAVAAHMKWRLGFIQWMNGKLQQGAYQKLEQDRDWYIGAAQTRDKMPSIDMAESLKNQWLRLIPKINQHKDGFKTVGKAENRKTHNS
jgi:hypothetical protein